MLVPLFGSLLGFFWPSILVVCLFAPAAVLTARGGTPKGLVALAIAAWLVAWGIYWVRYRVGASYGAGLVRDQLILTWLVAGLPILLAAITVVLLRKHGSNPWVQILWAALVGSLAMPLLGIVLGALRFARTGSWL
ncbi:MAG TPA: hypothetical protein VK535_08970 [Gemmatimonadales bacterium]|nr:hypothetical protein [Gemmatimonadales bacterium]